MKITFRNGIHAVYVAYSATVAFVKFFIGPISSMAEAARDKKLVLAVANPSKAYTDFSGYKEASIESRAIQDSRGRVLAQVKLWTYLGEQKCFREVTFLNKLLLASVGINRLPLFPLDIGKSDTPAALLEVTVRELESWLRNRTPGTQFGIESARSAAGKPQTLGVVSVPADVLTPPVVTKPVEAAPVPKTVPEFKQGSVPAPYQYHEANNFASDQDSQFQRAKPRPEIQAKVEQHTSGILQSVGMQERTTGSRKFPQYCLDILLTDGESRGMVKRLWGADLERALSESKSKLGDRVEVCHHGSMPMANSAGGSSYKNSYSMKVIK